MKTWLITGCSSGIGCGVATAVLEQGDQAAITARNAEKLNHFRETYGERVLTLSMDLADEDSIRAAVDAAHAHFGAVDVLVNNAGYGYRAAVEESTREEIDRLFQANVFGPAELMNLVLPEMRSRRAGTIVNVASIGAVRAAICNGWYSASKAALELISDAVYKEAGPLGVRVMIVEPGAFRTGFYDALQGTDRKIEDYSDTTGKWRVENVTNTHDQLGDPMRAGSVIVELVNSESCPERIALGSDAVEIIDAELSRRVEELHAWKHFSVRTDFPK